MRGPGKKRDSPMVKVCLSSGMSYCQFGNSRAMCFLLNKNVFLTFNRFELSGPQPLCCNPSSNLLRFSPALWSKEMLPLPSHW